MISVLLPPGDKLPAAAVPHRSSSAGTTAPMRVEMHSAAPARRLYTWTMRWSSKSLIYAACLGLLFLQLSGVHVHADDSGYIGVPETPFTHSHGHHSHKDAHHDDPLDAGHEDHGDIGQSGDYDAARDVSLLDLALSLFKLPLAILALVLLFALLPGIKAYVSFHFVYRVLSGRHTRWRPPLRAPPQPA